MNYVTFDIETYNPSKQNKIDTEKMRASVVGAYVSWIDEYIAFLEDEVKDFLNLLRQCDLVVGYNHLYFDLPVLQKYSDWDLGKLPGYDIMLEIEKKLGFKLKLDDVCKVNLGTKKTDSFEKYKHYYWEGKWKELIDYCMNDVRLTEEIFRMITATQTLKYNDLIEIKEVVLDKPQSGKVEIDLQTESIF
jgi:DEAD/DEAH box helicase domain-containing protein